MQKSNSQLYTKIKPLPCTVLQTRFRHTHTQRKKEEIIPGHRVRATKCALTKRTVWLALSVALAAHCLYLLLHSVCRLTAQKKSPEIKGINTTTSIIGFTSARLPLAYQYAVYSVFIMGRNASHASEMIRRSLP